jgi:RHS repeat-associated protein
VRTSDGRNADAEITFEHDPMGRPTRVAARGGEAHELRYDPAGRLVEHRRGALVMTWAYDADGLPTALGHPDGSRTEYDRDGAGRITALRHRGLGEVRLDRDPDGRLTDLHACGPHGDLVHTAWRFTGAALTGYSTTRGETTRSTRLTRDDTGRVVRSETDGRVRTFGYDPAGQLVAAAGPEGEWRFTYDPAGRLAHETGPDGVARTFTYDGAGQLVAAGPERFTYDAAGRRTSHTGPRGTREYGWDGLGNLSHVTDTPAGGSPRTTRLTVDDLGTLAAVDGVALMWDVTDPVTPLTWIGGRAVVGDGRPWALVPAGADDPWLVPDWQDTPDGPGADPWGTGAESAGPGPGHRGELAVAGLLWLRNRVYDPATRAFLTTDPLAPVAATPYAANAYHYAGNDPVNQLDPLGLRPMTDAALRAQRDQGGGILGDFMGGLGDLAGGARDALETGFRYAAGGALVTTGVLASIPGAAPALHGATGLVQAGATMANGDFNPHHIVRNFVNGPTTTFGQGMGLIGGGDLGYDRPTGMWTATGADFGYGRGGTTYGSTFVTGYDSPTRKLMGHEEVHAEQYARYGGGIGFPIAYLAEEIRHPGAENRYEKEAGLEAGGY